ncbi:MAG: hypothetical protein ONB07_01205 [candidate division KSB1 bacterium]|nr:hypothetical protein [candidate division KSB1 bacterium]MDZ7392292.1 hypothetical protein [candidate division KSB1 bacterium]MDZ7412197.1 hypothetical protein [candidate division KSB1 bacterium]
MANLTKQGPFSSLAFTSDEVNRVVDAIIAAVGQVLGSSEAS